MPINDPKLIGQLLVQKGLISVEQLENALAEKEKTGRFLGEICIDLGYVDEDNFYHILAEQFGTSYIKLKHAEIPHNVIELVPPKLATHYKIMPIDTEGITLTIAMSNPMDIHTLDELKLLLNKDIKTVLASEWDINEAIKKYYGVGADTIERIMPDKSESSLASQGQMAATHDIVSSAEDASIIKFVNQILMDAYKDRASDIHIEPYEDELKIRYRIDGVLYDTKVPPNIKGFQSAIISRIKIMAHLDIAERRLPQDGRIKVKVGEDEMDLRVSILPSAFGESIVIRLLSTKVFFGLENLGFLRHDLDTFERLIKEPHGIVFVTGPTGSGKTTTLYAALSKINNKDKKILTIEDPIEYQIKGIIQVQVHPRIGLTFSQGLRSMLRHDPDIMMVGEVRDYETAEITIRVALTGHLVFSTLHTNDASGGITRLIDMGVEPFLVASSVNAFIAQRLVRVICPECKVESKNEQRLLEELKLSDQEITGLKVYRGKGCESCKFTGYKGRTAIYEILVVNDAIRELILKKSSSEDIKRKALTFGMKTLRQDGFLKMKAGITTPEEILRVTQEQEIIE